MTRCKGQVIHNNQIVGHFLYNDTSGQALPRILATEEELGDYWGSQIWHKEWPGCICEKEAVKVLLWIEDHHWPAEACLTCKVITKGFSEYGDDIPCAVCKTVECTTWDGHSTLYHGHPLTGTAPSVEMTKQQRGLHEKHAK